MYAIVQVGSSQFKVSEGDVIKANRLNEEEGKSITLANVLMFANGNDVRVGRPFLKDVTITAKVVGEDLGPKRVAFKYRKRKDSMSKKGHRQKLTALNIVKISA